MGRTAIIIGAGPAGLTAAFELLSKTDIKPILLEKSDMVGGISRTANYQGNRIDIGGHRFFSKSDRVMNWWLEKLPVEAHADGGPQTIHYQRRARGIDTSNKGPDAKTEDRLFMIRERRSRIYYLRKFFDYPISLSPRTLLNLGLWRTAKIGVSYLKAMARPIENEKNLEQFFINRFGRELYLTFFKSYTEKVWGTPCEDISAEWGAQRIKGLDIAKALKNAAERIFRRKDLAQKTTETSLIEQFLYPKFGPGQVWEEVARRVREMGGEIHFHQDVEKISTNGSRVTSVTTSSKSGETKTWNGDFVFSTMPMRELVRGLDANVPKDVREVSEGLVYRDFFTVGLLLDRLKLTDDTAVNGLIRDNWIYIQEPEVQVGRLQIFNNWSPYMVSDPNKVWIGLEYFCNEGDPLWSRSDEELKVLGKEELARIDVIDPKDVQDAVVIRQPKAYPAYFGSYDRFDVLRRYLDGFENLFLVGRNGMHRYNNQDHSMLTAMTAVENILAGVTDKSNLWAVNTEMDYHEEK